MGEENLTTMDTTLEYTTESLGNMSPVYPDALMSIEAEADANSSFGAVWPSPLISVPLAWRFSVSVFPTNRDSFVGILSDDEAREMKAGINLFKKRFDDDLARRNKILFGE